MPVAVVNVWPIVAPGHERVGVLHAAAGVELEPVVALGLGRSCGSFAGSAVWRAGRDVADRLIAGREHRQDQLLGLALRQRARDVLGRDARGAHQGHAQAGDVERVAGARPERAARAADRAEVRVVADVGVQEVEDLLSDRSRAWPPLPG